MKAGKSTRRIWGLSVSVSLRSLGPERGQGRRLEDRGCKCMGADLRSGVALPHRFLDQLVERDEQGISRESESEAREDGRVEDRGGDEVMIGVEGGGGM